MISELVHCDQPSNRSRILTEKKKLSKDIIVKQQIRLFSNYVFKKSHYRFLEGTR